MDLIQLRTFVAVAEEEHLTRGAERIHLSLSAASAHIRAIEDKFGVKLFARTNRAMELTHAGKCLLERAKELLRQTAEFESQARRHAGEVAGTLTFGCNADASLSKAGEIIGSVRREYPCIRLNVVRRTFAAAQQGLQSGELDVATFIGNSTDPGFCYHTLRSITYRIAGPPKWAAALHRGDWAELATLPWLDILSNPVFTQMLDRPFNELGLTRNSVAATDSDVLLRSMIAAGVGLSLIRDDHAREMQRLGAVTVATHWETKSVLRLAYLQSRVQDPLIAAFAAATESVWTDPVDNGS